MSERDRYEEATQFTGDDLRTIAQAPTAQHLSSLTLPEIDQIVDRIARVAPAGNVPGFILNGLLRRNRTPLRAEDVRRDVQLLFKGVEQMLRDKAIFSTFYAGPAAVLWAYQNLLQLAGLNANPFPEGTWQFYADYALRDDTARHSCETHGFDTTLRQHGIALSPEDRLTAWVMTAVYTLHQYDELLANEWRERVYTDRLVQVTTDLPQADQFAGLYRAWEKQRPYRRDTDTDPRHDYPRYRRHRFDAFLAPWLEKLPAEKRQAWQQEVNEAESQDLPAYQQQMNIRAYLKPERYGERRVPIPLHQIHVGLIVAGRYYLLPACHANSEHPPPLDSIRAQITTLLAHPAETPPSDLSLLAGAKRTVHAELRRQLSSEEQEEIKRLRLAPILINAAQRPRHLPLSAIRQAERGLGDHPLTIFHTGDTSVFDLSHIFFDGAWGVALAEIMTNEALSWAAHLRALPPPQAGPERPYTPRLSLSPATQRAARAMARVATEASVETADIDLDAIRALRRHLKQRSAWLKLTVNDLLVLYRAIHAARYQTEPALLEQLHALRENPQTRDAATAALTAVTGSERTNPAILIPVDATRRHPAHRVFPLTFSVPLDELDLLTHHRETLETLAYRAARRWDRKRRRAFEAKRQHYLGLLASFGELMDRVKETAGRGESVSVKNIQLLANLPTGWQRLLDEIPNRFDVLNDLIKGREVFSNVGQMAPGSSVCRFITAKDDNEKKTLAWGVMSDASGKMILTLRDFRPHVAALTAAGEEKLAWHLANDYLLAYAQGLNKYVADLQQIVKEK